MGVWQGGGRLPVTYHNRTFCPIGKRIMTPRQRNNAGRLRYPREERNAVYAYLLGAGLCLYGPDG